MNFKDVISLFSFSCDTLKQMWHFFRLLNKRIASVCTILTNEDFNSFSLYIIFSFLFGVNLVCKDGYNNRCTDDYTDRYTVISNSAGQIKISSSSNFLLFFLNIVLQNKNQNKSAEFTYRCV